MHPQGKNTRQLKTKGFHNYLSKVKEIKPSNKVRLQKCLQGVFFALYDWSAGPVDGTDIYQSVVDTSRNLPLPIDPSEARSRESTSEVQKALDHFYAAYPIMFRQGEIFKIPVSKRRTRHRELYKKGNPTREF